MAHRRTSATLVVKCQFTYSYSSGSWGDMLTNFNGTSISYDEICNPSNWHNALSMSWDKRELSSLTLNDNSTLSFTYNSSGLRTSKQFVDSETATTYLHNYVLDGTIIMSETVFANGVEEYTLYYLYEGSAIIGFIYNNAYYYFQKNLQGDIVRILNAGGEVVTEYTYDAWGNVLSVTGTLSSTIGQINPFRYRGYYYDVETNWYYLQSRYYDSFVGRFLNADKYASTGQGIIGFNMFAYCNNNPIIFADYLGTDVLLVVSAGVIYQYILVALFVMVVVITIEPEVYEDIIVGVVDFVDSVTDALSDALCNYCANYVI